jgi:two-component system phosphate regulon sensor histidine kinase PhoR
MTGRVFTKLLFSFLLVLCLATAVLDFTVRRFAQHSLYARVSSFYGERAASLGAQLAATPPALLAAVVQAQALGTGADITVSDRAGNVVANGIGNSSRAPVHSIHPKVPAILPEQTSPRPFAGINPIVVSGSDPLRIQVEAGPYRAEYAFSLAGLHATLDLLQRDLLLASLLAFCLATFMAAFLAQRVATRLSRIVRFANRIAAGELSARLQEGRLDEISEVAHALDTTAVRLEAALQQNTLGRGRATSFVPGRAFAVSAAPMPGGGAVVVLHDVTEVERAERMRRDFVANVSHELRTPLTSISGYVETVLESGDSLSDQAREFLEIVLRNATRMNRLTADLLALASVEAGDYRITPQRIAADALLDDALEALAGMTIDSGVRLERVDATSTPVLADLDAMNQVFGNLIENAMKYGRTGGRVRLGAREEGETVEFFVQDFGPGIASEHLERIFERFYRVDKARSRDSGGTGLGLAIVRHIVLANKGTIRAESELGEGAMFLFTLPRDVS